MHRVKKLAPFFFFPARGDSETRPFTGELEEQRGRERQERKRGGEREIYREREAEKKRSSTDPDNLQVHYIRFSTTRLLRAFAPRESKRAR